MDNIEERQVEKWKDMEKWKKSRLNSEMIWKIWKKIGKRYEKYGRKISWRVKRYGKYDMGNMEQRQVELWKDMENVEEK